MWRQATRKVPEVSTGLQLPWQGDFAPLSVFHKRLTEADQQPRAPDGGTLGQHQNWILTEPTQRHQQDQRNTAVQAAFAEWSRQTDPPTLALAFDDQLAEVLPLDLGLEAGQQHVEARSSLLDALWEQQDLQLLHSLLQEPALDNNQAAAFPAAAPALLQEQQLLWDVQNAARSTTPVAGTAAAACAPSAAAGSAAAAAYTADRAVDALAAAADGVLQSAGPFVQLMAAAGPVFGGPALQEPTLLPPECAGMPPFSSPFAGVTLGQPEQTHHLHAPSILPGYQLLAPLTGGSTTTVSHTGHDASSAAGCSTGWAPTPCPDLAAAPATAATVAAAAAGQTAPHEAAAAAGAAILQTQQGPEDLLCVPPGADHMGQQQDLSSQPAEGLPVAEPLYTSTLPSSTTAAGSWCGTVEGSQLPGGFLQPIGQHTSPFQTVAPWELLAAAAEPVGVPVAEIVAAQEAARAAAALAQGLWGMDADAWPGGQGVRQGRVRKVQGGYGKKMHSSTKTKLQIKTLEEQHEELLTQYQAEESLNNILQQRWQKVSDAYDAALTRQLQRQALSLHAAAATASAAAAATNQPAGTSGPAAAAMAVPVGLQGGGAADFDALAAAVQQSWTSMLSQLVELIPLLAPCSNNSVKCRGAAPQQQQHHHAAEAPAGGAPAEQGPAAGGQAHPQATARELLGDDGLLSPFATGVSVAAASTAAGQVPAVHQSAEAAALSALSLPWGAGFLGSIRIPDDDDDDDDDEVSSATGSATSNHSSSSSGSHGVKRRRSVAAAAAGKEVCADLSLLLSASLSLHPPQAKHAKRDVSGRLTLTESDMRMLFSSIPSDLLSLPLPQQQQQQLGGPLQQQQPGGPLQQEQQQQRQQANLEASASLLAAQRCAGALVDSLWGLFQNVGLSGPALLYRCLGPRVAYCPCCCTRDPVCGDAAVLAGAVDAGQRSPPCSMMALLLDDTADGACVVGGCAGMDVARAGAPAAAAQAGNAAAAAAAAAPVCDVCAGLQFAQAVHASPAHWQRVREHLLLTPGQQEQLQRLWAGLQNAHAPFAARRQELGLGLVQQCWATGDLLGVAWYDTCFAGEAAAAVTDDLLAGIDDSLAADYGVLLETCRLLWGAESPLTLVQKVKCLVASYPFWPDYSLLQCLAEVGGTNPAGQQQAAAATAGQA